MHVLSLLLSLCFNLLFTAREKNDIELIPDLPSKPLTPAYYQIDILQKIADGKKLVAKSTVRMTYKTVAVEKNVRVGRRVKKIVRSVKELNGSEQVLAVVNMETGELKMLPIGHMARGEQKTVRGFSVLRLTENGVNSEYFILNDEREVVVALKTLVGDTRRNGRFRSAIYTPYSERLNLPVVREAGMRHFLKIDSLAYAKLKKLKVPSRINDSGSLVADIIPPQTILALKFVEHMDVNEFKARGREYMISKVLTTVGANSQNAYRYAISEIVRTTRHGKIKLPGARGLAQFIKSTHQDVVRHYPVARLKKDFGQAMDDHLNAVMEQICLADSDLSYLFKIIDDDHQWSDPPGLFEIYTYYIAAAYNGGHERAIRACSVDPPLRWKEGSGLAPQTVVYVAEFREVYNYLFPRETI